jgi:hypothetical protein
MQKDLVEDENEEIAEVGKLLSVCFYHCSLHFLPLEFNSILFLFLFSLLPLALLYSPN